MPCRKRSQPSPPAGSTPRRKSARLQQSGIASNPGSFGPIREQSAGMSVLSTDIEPLETWHARLEAAKKRIREYQPLDRLYEDKLQQSLEAGLEWFPEGGRESLARDIKSATDDDQLYAVFHNLITGLAVPMRARSRQSSIADSPHIQRKANVEVVTSVLDQPNAREHNFHDMCLRRDKYRCIVTGDMDTNYWEQNGCPEILHTPLEAAHIIPFAYASWDKSSSPSHDIASAWEVLWRCFPGVRRIGMKPASINDMSNAITLTDTLHRRFGGFNFAFRSTDVENTYELQLFSGFPPREKTFLPKDLRVHLSQSPGAEDIVLPSPILLDCHYRVAEILNASGMSEIIEKHLRKWEDIKASAPDCLREDGGTDISSMLVAGLWERVRC